MRYINGIDLLRLNFQKLEFRLNQKDALEMEMRNQTAHLLFKDKESKIWLLRTLKSNGVTCLFNCAKENYMKLPKNVLVRSNFDSFDTLLGELYSILEVDMTKKDHYLYNKVLNCIIIDNISNYYWDFKLLNQDPKCSSKLGYNLEQTGTKYYMELLDVVHKIHAKFKCNVIITSWDSDFEKGFGLKKSTPFELNSTLGTLTYLPGSFILEFDYMLHISSGCTQVFNKSDRRWRPI